MTKKNYIIAITTIIFALFSTQVFASTNSIILEVKRGDTLLGILKDANISVTDAANAITELKKSYDLRRLRIGQKVNVEFGIKDEGESFSLQKISLKDSKIKTYEIERDVSDNFIVKQVISPTHTELVKVSGTIDLTLFGALNEANIPYSVREKFIKNYSYDVDFQRDIRTGNDFEVLYEAIYNKEGEFVGSNDIVYSSLKMGDNNFTVYRYKNADGDVEYYDAEGKAIQKSLLRTPVNGARLSSGFGKRRHPILGYTRMHKGLDFAAPRGTPIYAAGSGTIVERGRKGAYGNYIKIRHKNGYSTAYGHMKAFAKGLRRGSKVKQGEVIGYVGTTGRSTGPHLHYEVIAGGRQINPFSVKTISTHRLKGVQYGIFKQYTQGVERLMAKLDAKNKLADVR